MLKHRGASLIFFPIGHLLLLGVRAKDEQTIYFTLCQPEEEADRAKTKAVLRDVLSNLNLSTVFPRLKHPDRLMHKMAQDLLLEDADNDPTAPIYGINDVLPLDHWTPRGMDPSATTVYCQTVAMMEPQLEGMCSYVYRQYGRDVMSLQIAVIMLWWQVAKTSDEAFFMAQWISAWSKLSWMNLRSNLRSVIMPPRLEGVPVLPMVVPFKVPLELHDAAGTSMGEYKMHEAGDPHLYPGTFAREPTCQTMHSLDMTRQEWTEWAILQDEPEGVSVSVAELIPDVPRDVELGELVNDESVIASSVASQKQEEVVLDQLGMPVEGRRNPMVDFQLLDFERRENLHPKDPTYKGFSYGHLTFLPQDFLEQHFQVGADRRVAKMNPMGSADAAYNCLLPHRTKKVDVIVQAEQPVATPSGQQTSKLVWACEN